jgi:hypothetical protein
MKGIVLGDNPQDDHEGGAENGHDGFMDFFRNDQGIGPDEQACGDPERPSHNHLLRMGHCFRRHFPLP